MFQTTYLQVALQYVFNDFILFNKVSYLKPNFKLKIDPKLCTIKKTQRKFLKPGDNFQKTLNNPDNIHYYKFNVRYYIFNMITVSFKICLLNYNNDSFLFRFFSLLSKILQIFLFIKVRKSYFKILILALNLLIKVNLK